MVGEWSGRSGEGNCIRGTGSLFRHYCAPKLDCAEISVAADDVCGILNTSVQQRKLKSPLSLTLQVHVVPCFDSV